MRIILSPIGKTTALIAAALLALGSSAAGDAPRIQPTISIKPPDPIVFAGSRAMLSAVLRGDGDEAGIRWTLIGPGRLNPAGLRAEYVAPATAGLRAIVAAASGTTATATTVRISAPPSARAPLVLVACFEGDAIDVRAAATLNRYGELAVPGQAGGIAVDSRRREAVIAARDRMVAVDLATMRLVTSPITPASLFSSVTELAGGLFAATDAQARAGQLGVRFYRVDSAGTPVAAGGIAAGETPEDIIADRSGRIFYVSNVNGNTVMRFELDRNGRARLTGVAKTATRPFGLALDERLHLLLVADNDTPFLSGPRSKPGLEAFDVPSLRRHGQAVSTGTPDALPLGVAVDEATSRAFVTNEGDGTVAVFDLPGLKRTTTLRTGLTPWLPAIDPQTHRLLVPSARGGVVNVYDVRRLAQSGSSFDTCEYPTSVAIARPDSPVRRMR